MQFEDELEGESRKPTGLWPFGPRLSIAEDARGGWPNYHMEFCCDVEILKVCCG
jgi:hypothetical protein